MDLLQDGKSTPYDRRHLADVGGDGPLGDPEQVDHAVLGQVGPIVHERIRRTLYHMCRVNLRPALT